MKKKLCLGLALLSVVAISTTSKAHSLFQRSFGNSLTISFDKYVERYLRGTFASTSWGVNNNYKFADVTDSMTPEEGKIKEYSLTNISLNRGDLLKVWSDDDVWYQSFAHRWGHAVEKDGDNNYKVGVESANYSLYFKIYNNGNTQLYLTADNHTLFLNPNSDWKSDGARFAAYFFDDSRSINTWVNMVTDGSYYRVSVPQTYWSGESKVIFCRMNGSTSTNNWDNKWNQTSNLDIQDTSKYMNIYNITGWDNSGNWNNVA